MTVSFTKTGNKWVGDITVTQDFNLHVEKEVGALTVAQSTVEDGTYDPVYALEMAKYDEVMDKDVTALIYPKHLRFAATTLTAPIVIITYNA